MFRKDRVALLLLLTAFMLLGSKCNENPFKDDDEKKRLPDRALAASSLLRTYYDTRTFPKKMTNIKIPEGDNFDDDELTVEFDMGGTDPVEVVTANMFIVGPAGGIADVELEMRCIGPDGSKSSWLPFVVVFDDKLSAQAEMSFQFEFDHLANSDGRWRIQLRDPVEDDDGRCLFRNGTLRINNGEPAGVGGNVNETQTPANPRYGTLAELKSYTSYVSDIGAVGVNDALRNDFTFTSTFYVRNVSFYLAFYRTNNAAPEEQLSILIVSPAGGWYLGALNFDTDVSGSSSTYIYNSATFALNYDEPGAFRPLRGEISSGTWSIYLWDNKKDNEIFILTEDVVTTPMMGSEPVVTGQMDISMTLEGVN